MPNINTNTDLQTAKEAILATGYKRNGFVYAEIPISMLNLNLEYQRPQNSTHARSLASNWDDRMCDDVLVSYRNGELNVVDGQTRCLARLINGHKTVGCKVVEGLSLAQEALIFADQTRCVRRLTNCDSFKARVIGNDVVAVKLKGICDDFGIQVSYTYGKGLHAIKALETLYREVGEEGIRRMFNVIIDAGWKDIGGGMSAPVMKAICNVYKSVDETNHSRTHTILVDCLKSSVPQLLIGAAKMKYPNSTNTDALTRILLARVSEMLEANLNMLSARPTLLDAYRGA